MNKRWNILWPVIAIIALLFLMLLLDYFNIPTKLEININNFNWNVQTIVINAIVTISMFLAAYYLVDRWNTHKHQNQEATAKMLLKTTYKLCAEYIRELDKPYNTDLLIQSKNGNKQDGKVTVPFYEKYEEIPFDHDKMLMQYFSDGTLTSQHMETYIKIKTQYTAYVNLYVHWHESKEKMKVLNELKAQLLTEIPNAITELR